ncbi:hypothetical protein BHM03_00024502 [Ensete ventricosum]|nr:hypothetical protein BHM03_00024502 [Ensete ventricosum]
MRSSDAGPHSIAKECYTFYVSRLKCHLGLVLPTETWALGDSSLVYEGCVGSSGHQLVGREPGRSPYVGVDFWYFVELQSPGVYCNVLGEGGVAYPWLGILFGRSP